MIKKIKKIMPVVKDILEQKPECRNSDQLLILSVWANQNPRLREPNYPFMGFAVNFLSDSYANTESIRRSRQKIQEENPHLRGTSYKGRKKLEEEVRHGIN